MRLFEEFPLLTEISEAAIHRCSLKRFSGNIDELYLQENTHSEARFQ